MLNWILQRNYDDSVPFPIQNWNYWTSGILKGIIEVIDKFVFSRFVTVNFGALDEQHW